VVRAAILDHEEFEDLERESDELIRIFSAMIANAKKSQSKSR
jgi:hypothetical protein